MKQMTSAWKGIGQVHDRVDHAIWSLNMDYLVDTDPYNTLGKYFLERKDESECIWKYAPKNQAFYADVYNML